MPSILQTTVYNLISGANYQVAYTALNLAGWSVISPVLSFVAGNLPLPPGQAPSLMLSTSTSIQFSWVPTSDIGGASLLLGYNIYAGTTMIASVSASTLSYTYTAVTAGQSYLISITAVTSIGEG